MNVISLFNGMGTLRQAFSDMDIKVNKYYSSEIKPYAIELQQHHFPDVIQVGDINNWKEWDIDWKSIDFIGSGSPCQDLSAAGNRKGLNGNRSSLFFTFIEILEHVKKLNPDVKYLQENVGSAPKLDVGIMSRALGVYPVRINSNLLTAQNRDRYYWTNIKTKKTMFDVITDIPQPKDLNIKYQSILESGTIDRQKSPCILEAHYKGIYKDMDKMKSFIKIRKENGFDNQLYSIEGDEVRNLTKTEFCRLQGFPDNYCDILTIQKSISLLGDGWTLPIIIHILSFMNIKN
jgi:site-specific DNA-cytosine methylase